VCGYDGASWTKQKQDPVYKRTNMAAASGAREGDRANTERKHAAVGAEGIRVTEESTHGLEQTSTFHLLCSATEIKVG
jgi:hypothetical protein